jgi:predicted carbohydrate-binding protein with CBM5 and CBM33 domain
MAKRGRPAKSPFADLDLEFKDAIASMSTEDINKRIAEVAKNQEENLKAMKEDQQLAEAKAAAASAGAGYKEATKMNRLRVRYAMEILGARGQE